MNVNSFSISGENIQNQITVLSVAHQKLLAKSMEVSNV